MGKFFKILKYYKKILKLQVSHTFVQGEDEQKILKSGKILTILMPGNFANQIKKKKKKKKKNGALWECWKSLELKIQLLAERDEIRWYPCIIGKSLY